MALSVAERQRRRRARLRGEVVAPAPYGSHQASKTRCSQNHPYDEANTYWYRGNRQCRACRAVYRLAWQRANPEVIAENNRAHYAANPEARREYARRWQREHREQANLTSRLKKQRRRAAGVLTSAEWVEILDRFGHVCLACGTDGPLTVDHVVPVVLGGANTAENVQPLCGRCNSSKGTKTIDYRPAGVPSTDGE